MRISIFSLNKQKHIQILDFLKAFAIITIVLMHLIQDYMTNLPSILRTASSLGGTGVHVFFFASGCGLYLSYLKHKTTFTSFIKKRFNKVYIPYILIVFISFLLPWMYKGQDRFIALLSHVFLFKMFIPQFENSFGIQMWFLSTLFQLYLIFLPLCKLRERISAKNFIIGSLLISIAYSCFVFSIGQENNRVINSFFLQFIWEFCLGMELARALKDGKIVKLSLLQLVIIAIVGLGLEGIIAIKFPSFKAFNDIPAFFGYMALAVILYYFIGKQTTRAWTSVCKYSYEWYLVHILVFTTIFLVSPVGLMQQSIVGVIVLVISYVVAMLYWKLIHKINL